MGNFTESTVELAALDWLREVGYTVAYGPDLEPEGATPERAAFDDVVLVERLRAALARLNPHLPSAACEDALRRVLRTESTHSVLNNAAFHRLLTEGVDVSYKHQGQTKYDKAWLVDFAHPERNDWLAANQVTVTGVDHVAQLLAVGLHKVDNPSRNCLLLIHLSLPEWPD